ncbi:ribbon-helix-helix protein, CopG family [Methylobacterium sp. SyP6R]|uniref:ribbon-helix-helix protein, CopG family n=1 Tax=Methylobacterium sp. SyP6R TaxID=2718876 RepID=UPI001F203789|nr:ribbon-helix-helix protein, CopG family [Methylobacterium sp. SyP6R]MCF4125186.1 ribbon-helix-helix domain-containing protein [Methylobacterium sp. SyP6R]
MAENNHLSVVTEHNKRRIRLQLDEEIVRKLEHLSETTGRSIDEIVEEFVEKYLPNFEV